MKTFPLTPSQLREAYERGENITALLRDAAHAGANTDAIIEVAYDLQAGSYLAIMADVAMREHKVRYADRIAREILTYAGQPTSLLEAGVGEATTLAEVLRRLALPPELACGFDLSWSRLLVARQWLAQAGLGGVRLCTGSLREIPLADDSVDVVYTSHSIEPNGGQEIPILEELFRVTARWLLLLEPGDEIASAEGRQRMRQLGYCAGLAEKCRSLGFDVVEQRAFEEVVNPLNPTQLLVIRKGVVRPAQPPEFACPIFKTPLVAKDGVMLSPGGLHVYPVLREIPCLRSANAVVASHFEDDLNRPPNDRPQ